MRETGREGVSERKRERDRESKKEKIMVKSKRRYSSLFGCHVHVGKQGHHSAGGMEGCRVLHWKSVSPVLQGSWAKLFLTYCEYIDMFPQ